MAESLRDLLRSLRRAQISRDRTTAESIAKGLYPDEARLRSALRPGVDDAVVRRIAEMHRQFAARGWSEMLAADDAYTEVLVFGATGEAIARGGAEEFDPRAQGVATTILRSETRYFVASFVPPGERLGQKYHLFYHDGERWGLLGPIWLVLRSDSGRA
ncbi:MAG: hypothetical protein HRU70_14535 [Phycisphaeraceae bacterium]|nr:MAG: hypothetical protein HRU70_14535 [Phycisphaeraceae bacterium]